MRDVLITAGATRNPIDAIRYLSAHSSGRTGVSLANAIARKGAKVHLLGSPLALAKAQNELVTREFTSTRNLQAQMRSWVEEHRRGIIVHAAAVGDYEPDPIPGKIVSGSKELLIRLKPCPKILDSIRDWDPSCYLVSFKAAPPKTSTANLRTITRAQLARTGSDLVFGNIIGSLETNVVITDTENSRLFERREAGLRKLSEILEQRVFE